MLKDIDFYNSEIESNSSFIIKQRLENLYGQKPNTNITIIDFIDENSQIQLESISLYFLNRIYSDEKINLFNSRDLYDRVEW